MLSASGRRAGSDCVVVGLLVVVVVFVVVVGMWDFCIGRSIGWILTVLAVDGDASCPLRSGARIFAVKTVFGSLRTIGSRVQAPHRLSV